MKIERHEIEETSIEAFADKHDLVMEVRERKKPVGDPLRYYAHFKSAEAREGACCLIGLFGNGRTPEEAIAEYASVLSLRTLIIDPMRDNRREIEVPRLSAERSNPASEPMSIITQTTDPSLAEMPCSLPVVETLNKLPEVTWDRWAGDGIGHVSVFGWIARDDGRSDFALVMIDKDGPWLISTSSSIHSADFSARLGMGGDGHTGCRRVEDHFPAVRCVKLAKVADTDQCPSDTCSYCTGEACMTHGLDPCECDGADRHYKEENA